MSHLRNLVLLVSVLCLSLSAPVFAQSGHTAEGGHGTKSHHGKSGKGKSIHEAACWTDTLTEEQKDKMAKLRLEKKKVKYLIKAQMKVKKVELATLLTQDNPDQMAMEKKIEEIVNLKREKMQKIYAIKLDLRKMLTPEQRVLFDMKMLKKAYEGKKHGY